MSGPSRPAVTLKIATSLDGRIATASGESQWITCEESRRAVQTLRAAHDAILVGVETAIKDNPLLTVRTDPPPGRQPLRIVADSRLRTPLNSRLIGSVAEAPVALATGVDIDERRADPYLDRGVDVWELPIAPFGGVSVTGLLARCAEEGATSAMIISLAVIVVVRPAVGAARAARRASRKSRSPRFLWLLCTL